MSAVTLAAHDWELWTSPCRIVVTDADRLDAALGIADELLAEVEVAASRFRPDSEVLNLRAGWNDLSPMLADLVREALTAASSSSAIPSAASSRSASVTTIRQGLVQSSQSWAARVTADITNPPWSRCWSRRCRSTR